jgi:hypothetical protein
VRRYHIEEAKNQGDESDRANSVDTAFLRTLATSGQIHQYAVNHSEMKDSY